MVIGVLLLALSLGVSGVAIAGPSDPNAIVVYDHDPSRSYGTAAKIFVAYSPWDFVPISSSVTYGFRFETIGQTLVRTNATGDRWFKAPVHLPAGALVTELQAVFCDGSLFRNFELYLIRAPRMAPITFFAGPATADFETPGCVDRTVVFGTPIQIDNNNNSYHLEVNMGGFEDHLGGNLISLGSVRIGYVLQVSAPGAQMFNDVPTNHPFFPFIQALVAAGITTGCDDSPPMFCPDGVVTRKQMAAFLARALGLHWAP